MQRNRSEMPALDVPDVDRVIRYSTNWNARSGECRVRVWWSRRTIVVTEVDGNPGPSITNAAEQIAEVVEAQFDVNVMSDDIALIEHYGPRYHRGVSLDRVRFRYRDALTGRPSDAFWKPAHETHAWLYEALTDQ